MGMGCGSSKPSVPESRGRNLSHARQEWKATAVQRPPEWFGADAAREEWKADVVQVINLEDWKAAAVQKDTADASGAQEDTADAQRISFAFVLTTPSEEPAEAGITVEPAQAGITVEPAQATGRGITLEQDTDVRDSVRSTLPSRNVSVLITGIGPLLVPRNHPLSKFKSLSQRRVKANQFNLTK